eukprot:9492814-Pyramimonas_sp.AAC.1
MTRWLPPGPSTKEESNRRAERCLKNTCGGHRGDICGRRLCSLLEYGYVLQADFSGAQGAEMMMKMLGTRHYREISLHIGC